MRNHFTTETLNGHLHTVAIVYLAGFALSFAHGGISLVGLALVITCLSIGLVIIGTLAIQLWQSRRRDKSTPVGMLLGKCLCLILLGYVTFKIDAYEHFRQEDPAYKNHVTPDFLDAPDKVAGAIFLDEKL